MREKNLPRGEPILIKRREAIACNISITAPYIPKGFVRTSFLTKIFHFWILLRIQPQTVCIRIKGLVSTLNS